MSRIAKRSIIIPDNVEVFLDNQYVQIKGQKGILKRRFNNLVEINLKDKILNIRARKSSLNGWMQAGTVRSLINSMILGVTYGFSKKLILVGVGYKFALENSKKKLILSLGYSHNIVYFLPFGIDIELISQTEIVIKGIDKQLVGQVSANLRLYRRPDAYKGKGIRYYNEFVKTKEAKKK
ncbi:MAG: 50S ribosomal protein L6 [Buchnera aphidicola (Periphyllus acericola)]|uniref:50S ribosomal protein L6 n=1 Tax=Buchnera aphidicola TaxID=9 RepID=UPI0030CAFBF6|nr:50S ribosomal protein L6 [Buchnera aphidicola (Periphyllus acericola)]